MKVIIKHNEKYYLDILPRFYFLENLEVIIREPFSNVVVSKSTNATYKTGLISVDLQDFLPVSDTKYSIQLKRVLEDEEMLIWTGQALYITQEIPSESNPLFLKIYDMTNSNENNLRF